MKYSITFPLILFAFAACNEEEPEPCNVQPEPFRFVIVDPSGSNRLSDGVRPDNTRIFYLRGGEEVTLELDFEGNREDTYGVSPVLSLLSEGGVADTYLVERGDIIDTLLVQIARQEPGNNCSEFVFSTVTFNEVPAMVDTIAEVPVFVLAE